MDICSEAAHRFSELKTIQEFSLLTLLMESNSIRGVVLAVKHIEFGTFDEKLLGLQQ